MEPSGGRAGLPCNADTATTAAVCGPLFIVTGASGSGKTAVLRPARPAGCGASCVTFDADLAASTPAGCAQRWPAGHQWPAFRDAWLAVAHGVAQSGMPHRAARPASFPQSPATAEPARRWVGEIRFLLLDCPRSAAGANRSRLVHAWRSRDIDEQAEFGRWLRRNIADHVDTSHGTPNDVAAVIAAWVAGHMAQRS